MTRGTMTSRPPVRSGPQISHTEKSNENEWNSVHTSVGPNSNHGSVNSSSRETFRCETTTPFGLPVEPEV